MLPSNVTDDEYLSQKFDADSAESVSEDSELSDSNLKQLKSWKLLRECLQSIPVTPVDLVGVVSSRCRQLDVAGNVSYKNSAIETKASVAKRHTTIGQVSAALAALAAVLVVSATVHLSNPGSQTSSGLALLQQDGVSNAMMDSFGDPATWDVLLVTVSEGADRQVVQQLRQSFQKNGMPVRSAAVSDDLAGPAPVVAATSGMMTSDLFEVLTGESASADAEWNPDQIGDLDRTEMLARFVESLKTPSRSEEHFGEMVVGFSSETVEAIESVVHSGKLASESNVASVLEPAIDGPEPGTTIQAGPVSNNQLRPVLVVVRTRKESAPVEKPAVERHGLRSKASVPVA